MQKTNIEWARNPDGTQGYTWNPITGCTNGCNYCYAERIANSRLKTLYCSNRLLAPTPPGIDETNNPFWPRFWFDRIKITFKRKIVGEAVEPPGRKPRGIFVCDMGDLFGNGVPESWTRIVMEVIKSSPQDRFYLLTKQPQNLIKWSPFPSNCYIGVSETKLENICDTTEYLRRIQAKVRFISFEPLLDFNYITIAYLDKVLIENDIGWLIIGQQTPQTKATTPKVEWIMEIVEAADKAQIPVFLKDNLDGLFTIGDMWALQDDCRTLRQEFPEV